MKGRAPNCSKMGSQTEVRKKLKPNLWRERTEPCHNSKTRSTVMRTTDAANKKVIMRAISSPSRSRERNEREPATGPALGTMVVVVAKLHFTGRYSGPSVPLRRLPSEALRRIGPQYSSYHPPA